LLAMMQSERHGFRLLDWSLNAPTWERMIFDCGCLFNLALFAGLGAVLGCFVRALDWAQDDDDNPETESEEPQ
jgi:hypothetical protein